MSDKRTCIDCLNPLLSQACQRVHTEEQRGTRRQRFEHDGQRWLAVATPNGPRFFMKIQGKWSGGYSATEYTDTELAIAADKAKGQTDMSTVRYGVKGAYRVKEKRFADPTEARKFAERWQASNSQGSYWAKVERKDNV